MPEPFDETAKAFYREVFQEWGMRVETEYEVFARARTIDLVVECSPEDQARLQGTVFDYFQRINDLELKGPADPLTYKDYNLVMTRAWALGIRDWPRTGGTNADEPSAPRGVDATLPVNRTVTVVCVGRPDRILGDPDMRFARTAEPGIYLCEGQLSVRIIVPSELPLEERYYPLLPLARGRKLQEFIELCIHQGWIRYLQMALDVGLAADPLVDWGEVMDVLEMDEESLEELSALIGRVIDKALTMPDRFPGVVQRVAEIQRKGREIGEKDGEKRGQESGEVMGRRNTLLRLLHRKFGSLPLKVEEQIQAATDITALDRWLDQVLEVDSLEGMGFGV